MNYRDAFMALNGVLALLYALFSLYMGWLTSVAIGGFAAVVLLGPRIKSRFDTFGEHEGSQ